MSENHEFIIEPTVSVSNINSFSTGTSWTDLNVEEEIYIEDNEKFHYCFLDNIRDLERKNPENVSDFIQSRFFAKTIYTWSGQTLIAVNPYETVPYQDEKNKKNPPSIKSLISKAWFKLSQKIGTTNQCLVISGDSGSGKTHSANLALKYLTNYYDSVVNDILQKTCWSSPLLTAFGNASTAYNSNSSRFGKLLQLQCENQKIVGAFLQTYLLERSRVSQVNKGETNFHIFGQILENLDNATMSNIYLNKSCFYKIAPRSDYYENTLQDTLKSFEALNIVPVNEIFKVLSLILNLGNVDFVNYEDQNVISNDSKPFMENCAKLLFCNPYSLSRLFVKRLIAAKLRRGTICYTSCINVEECEERRNSLMRFLYEKLFLWLVKQINKQIYTSENSHLLGILDIYGFETFATNTFEQLCINYANERLQQFYLNDYNNNQSIYAKERNDLVQPPFDFSDYNNRIQMLDGTVSVFGILNEECLVKRYNTDVFVNNRILNVIKQNKSIIKHKPSTNYSAQFSINHYAGTVTYDCKSMTNKNRDKIPDEMVSFLQGTDLEFIHEILDLKATENVNQGKTLLIKFKKSLDDLMSTLKNTEVHYIKCLKPNKLKQPEYFDNDFFIEQLRYNGIIDTLYMDFQNFPVSIKTKIFDQKFSLNILNTLEDQLWDEIYVGNEHIFFKESAFNMVVKFKNFLNKQAVKKIQKSWRKRFEKKIKAAQTLQNFYRNVIRRKYQQILDNNFLASFHSDTTLVENKLSAPYLNLTCKDCASKHSTQGSVIDIFNSLTSINFRRNQFRRIGMASYQRISQVPVRLHLKKTCFSNTHILPKSELPMGLYDIF